MIEIKNVDVYNFHNAIRGMRNALESWHKSDSKVKTNGKFVLGSNDLDLAQRLITAGSASHRKFLRQIGVSFDLTAGLYFTKQLDTYKVGTVRNSESTMHRITSKPFQLNDFSFDNCEECDYTFYRQILAMCEELRQSYLETRNKAYWRQLIQILPSAYNQMSTYTMNYENLRNIYFDRRRHKLQEWREFCQWIETLPYAEELITYTKKEKKENG